MAAFGRYQTVRELHRTGYTTVYSACDQASDEETFAVKLYQPSALLQEREQAKTEITMFLNSARIQQEVAAAGAQHWAPIYEHGLTPEGAFYVTDRYDRSLQQLIDGRLRISAQSLHAIVEAIAQGLVELKKNRGRPHGNLKAANVLIRGTGDMAQAQLVLCDPLPDDHVDTDVHWDSDLRDIAEFMYELVVHRPSPTMAGWQAPDSKEWSSLGRHAGRWRDLCNRLLGTAAGSGMVSVEALMDDLAELKKTTKPIVSLRWRITAGLILIGCIAFLAILPATRRKIAHIIWPPEPPTIIKWRQLCQEYTGWVETLFKEGLGGLRKRNERAKRWRQDAHLQEIVERIRLASYLDRVGGRSVENMCNIETEAELEKLRASDKHTDNALVAIEQVKCFFDTNSTQDPNAYQPWPLLLEIHEHAIDFEKRRWHRPAAYLHSLVEKVKPGENKTHIAQGVDEVLELDSEGTLTKIYSALQEIEEYQETIKDSKDPVLARYDDTYVNNAAAGAADVGELADNLGKATDAGRVVADFLKQDWQTKVDRETFFAEHGQDSVQTVTSNTFDERLVLIKEYNYLSHDPRNSILDVIGRISDSMPLVRASNPVKAEQHAEQLQQMHPQIQDINKIPKIRKYASEIEQKVNDFMPKLNKLLDKVLADAEPPQEYYERIKSKALVTSETSQQINNKWIALRDDLFDRYPLSGITKDMRLYSELRNKIDKIDVALVTFDKELMTELPPQLDAQLQEKDWNLEIKHLYEQKRQETVSRILKDIPLTDKVPDIEHAPFRQFCLAQFEKFRKWRTDLGGIAVDFNKIEQRLELCYLLDDKGPEDGAAIRHLWQKWKNTDVLNDSRINRALETLIARVSRLEQIETSSDKRDLVQTASDPQSQTEAVYAAWTRLGELTEPQWPNEAEDWESDKNIQQRLKSEFERIKLQDRPRGDRLAKTLAETSLARQITFTKASIRRHKDTINAKADRDKILTDFEKFQPHGPEPSLGQIKDLGTLAQKIAHFVSDPNWPQEFRVDLLAHDQSPLYNKSTLTAEDFEHWLQVVPLYEKLEHDPRTAYPWIEKIAEITKLIEDELGIKQDGSSKQGSPKSDKKSWIGRISEITRPIEDLLGRKRSGPSKEDLAKLEQEYADFAVTVEDVNNLLALPAVEKNKDKIDANICKDLWDKLRTHEAAIKLIIKPQYCKYLEIMEDKTRQVQHLAFAKTTKISENFEPVNISQLQSSTEKKTPIEAITSFVKGAAETVLSIDKLQEFLKKTVELADWDEIRRAVNDKKTKWLDFFHTIDLNNAKNLGWPKYIVSKKDRSVLLRFIPANADNPEPFYMAIQEITNAQYSTFLQESGAEPQKRPRPPKGWSIYVDQTGNRLIISTSFDHPPSSIKWDKTTNIFVTSIADADIPVTWVTYSGAQSYAKSLGAELPTASQHEFACRAGTSTIYPWGNGQAPIADYAHVRAAPWRYAATQYNSKKDSTVEHAPAPIGAIKDYGPNETLDPTRIVHKGTPYDSPWPIAHANRPNNWGLYDMIGNVWEWCRTDKDIAQPVICGGSCLSPPQDAGPNSKHTLQDPQPRASDIGFRVVVAAR